MLSLRVLVYLGGPAYGYSQTNYYQLIFLP